MSVRVGKELYSEHFSGSIYFPEMVSLEIKEISLDLAKELSRHALNLRELKIRKRGLMQTLWRVRGDSTPTINPMIPTFQRS